MAHDISRRKSHRWLLSSTAGALLGLTALGAEAAPTYTSLHEFDGLTGSLGQSYSSLKGNSAVVQGSDGHLYGTAQSDQSAPTCGTIFRVTRGGVFTKLHDFNLLDGCNPQGGLTVGKDGAFYGATYSGGTYNNGVIFRVTQAGRVTTVASFPSYFDPKNVGFQEKSVLLAATDGNLYGVARRGGNSYGTVYKVTPAGVFTLLHKFSYTDGSQPDGPLVQGQDGHLYGVTPFGGTYNQGVAFKITRSGTLTVLHHFGATASDPRAPTGALVQHTDGTFYGASTIGGSRAAGTIFKMTTRGAVTKLYDFDSGRAGLGSYPFSGLIKGKDGNFYGATSTGGAVLNACNCGVLFKVTPRGAYTALAAFDGSHGKYPYRAAPMQHSDGRFYGLAVGGTYNHGVLYRLTR